MRKVLAIVERGRKWGHLSGPFFYVEGQTGNEVPSGGRAHDANLYFECVMPPLAKPRAYFNDNIINGNSDKLKGNILIYQNDANPSLEEQSVIIPIEKDCLRLIGYNGLGCLLSYKAQKLVRSNATFDVGIGYR
jgi:hypothetical protein